MTIQLDKINSERFWPWIYFFAGVASCLLRQPWTRGFWGDNVLYFFVAERVASGVPPHISLVDHKHALSSLISGAAIAVGRLSGLDDVVALRIVSIIAASAAVALIWRYAFKLWASEFAAHAGALTLLIHAPFLAQAAMGARPKVFMVPFIVAALLAAATRKPARSGAHAMAAFLCWQPAGLLFPALGAPALLGRERFRTVLMMALGAFVVFVFYELYFVGTGHLGTQLYQSFVMAGAGDRIDPPEFFKALRFVAGDFHGANWLMRLAGPLFLVVLAGGWIALLFNARRLRDEACQTQCGLLLAATGSVAFTFLDFQAFPDRFFVEPFVALGVGAAAYVLTLLVSRRANRFPRTDQRQWLRVAGVGLAMLAIVVTVTGTLPRRGAPKHGLTAQRDLGGKLAELSEHESSIWVLGALHLLAFAKLPNASPFGLLLDPMVVDYMERVSRAPSYAPFTWRQRPKLVFVRRTSLGRKAPWVLKGYRRVEWPSFNKEGVRVYVRRDQFPRLAQYLPNVTVTYTVPICGDPVGRPVSNPARRKPEYTSQDVEFILKTVLEAKHCLDCVCDVDGSGKIDSDDARKLAAKIESRDVTLQCPPCRASRSSNDRLGDGGANHANRPSERRRKARRLSPIVNPTSPRPNG